MRAFREYNIYQQCICINKNGWLNRKDIIEKSEANHNI